MIYLSLNWLLGLSLALLGWCAGWWYNTAGLIISKLNISVCYVVCLLGQHRKGSLLQKVNFMPKVSSWAAQKIYRVICA